MTTMATCHRTLVALAVAAACSTAAAQSPPKQVVKPPVAEAWIDVATFSGMSTGSAMAGTGMGSALGSLMGGQSATKANFGQTTNGPDGRFVDVTLFTSRNAALAEAQQTVPDGFKLGPSLKLLHDPTKHLPPGEDLPVEYDPPKVRFVMYWGCSESVRPGQPKILEFGPGSSSQFNQHFQSRRATKRGAHSGTGRPNWPNKTDDRGVPAGASLVGQHAFTGQGVPERFKFEIAAAQDLMPPLRLRQTDTGQSILFEWNALPHARGYFLASIGPREGDENTMVLWSSSELPDTGLGLIDYQTNGAVDNWIREKVVLPAATTRCAVPKEAIGSGFVRAIAYGTEVNLAYPPRPDDPAIAWEPEWNVKIRVKAVASVMPGMPDMGELGLDDESESGAGTSEAAPAEQPKKKKKFNPLDVVKDVVKDQLP